MLLYLEEDQIRFSTSIMVLIRNMQLYQNSGSKLHKRIYIFFQCASQKEQFETLFMQIGHCWKFDPTWPLNDLLLIFS